jgi:hypothetical protein
LSIDSKPAHPKKLAVNCALALLMAGLPILNKKTFGVLPDFSVFIRKASKSSAALLNGIFSASGGLFVL